MRRIRTLAAALGCCAAFAFRPAAAAPRLTSIFPSGGQRGAVVRVELGGTGLEQLTGWIAAGAGIDARLLPPEPDRDPRASRVLEVAVAPDAPLGKIELRVFDRTGASNAKFFYVGQFPERVEREPNDGPSQAEALSLPVTINGRIGQNSDIDSYRFSLRKGERVSIEVHSQRLLGELGNTWLKGYAWVEDSRGRILAESDGYYRWDPYIEFDAPEDGEYTVSFRDIQYRGNAMGVYRLTVGVIPHLWSIFPMGGCRGRTVPVRLFGSNLGDEDRREIRVPDDAPEGVREERFAVGSVWTNPVPFVVGRFPDFLEQEPNDDLAAANPVTLPVEVHGMLDRPGDVDSFRFAGRKGQAVVLEVLSRGTMPGMPLDSFLTLRRMDGSVVAENDDGPDRNRDDDRDRDSRIERVLDADGEYVVQIRDLDGRGGPAFVYRLSIRPPQPYFVLRAETDRVLLRSGASVAIDLALDRREGFSGPVSVRVEGLPDGVTAEPLTFGPGQAAAKLTLRSAPGAKHGAAILRILGEATVGGERLRRLATGTETYNTQGTAYRRDLIGPVLVVAD